MKKTRCSDVLSMVGLKRDAMFSGCAKRSFRRTAQKHLTVIFVRPFFVRIIITFPRAASEGVDSVAALPVV